MPAPIEVIHALESIVDIYLSGIRHRERAAFILTDNLVELACKLRAKQLNGNFNMHSNFYDSIDKAGLPSGTDLRSRLESYHQLRNPMQHQHPAMTVDPHYCAQAILDAVELIDTLWTTNSQRPSDTQFQPWLKTALRIVLLYSPKGDPSLLESFQRAMREKSWRGNERKNVRSNEVQILPGERDYWHVAVRRYYELVEECLNEIGAP